MTPYLVTMATDHHSTCLKMWARGERTVTENVRCWCFYPMGGDVFILWGVASTPTCTFEEEIQDSLGFWIPRWGFRIPGTGFQFLSVELEFWISIVSGIPDSLSCIPDSKAQDCRFHQQKFPDSEILIPLHGVISIFFHYCLFWITWVTVLLC